MVDESTQGQHPKLPARTLADSWRRGRPVNKNDAQYFLGFAQQAASWSSCLRRQVGAVIVIERHVVATGYNGTPSRATNCDEGGCPRCASEVASGTGLELCLCVHAEQNAIAQAARYGPYIAGGTLYCTHQPCFNCLTLVVQSGIRRVVYLHQYIPANAMVSEMYERLCDQTRLDVVQYVPQQVESE